jgi:signal transduction histidine kinase/CheY-like chemotaxis protein/HPt (histidine-containing phosphotransfer) domain-containing protein
MNTNSNEILYRNCFRLCLLSLLTAFMSSVAAQGVTTVPLNDEEHAFLAAHPIVRVHNETKFPPFNFTQNNQPMGYSIDYMNLLAKKLGIEVDYVSGPSWNEFMDMIKIGDIDVMLNISVTPERREYILFTPAYLRLPNVLASRSDDAFDSMSQLFGKTVAYVEGFWHEDIIHRDFPKIKTLAVANTLASLEAVASGKADAVLGRSAALNYLISENSMTGLSVSVEVDLGLPDNLIEQRIGVRTDWQLFRSALTKAMRTVTHEEDQKLKSRWLGPTNLDSSFSLTEEERIWLSAHRTLRLGLDSAWRPIEFISEAGEYSGMTSDFMKLLTDRLDLEMVPVVGLEWTEVLDNMKAKKLDIIAAVNRSPDREQYMNFTSPYLSFPHVIINLDDSVYIQEIEDLYGKRVVVERGFITQERLTRDHPQIHLVLADNTLEALELTSLGEVDAYVGSLPGASYLMSEHGISNLKVAAPTQYTTDLRIGVRKDWPQLVGILQKALDSIAIVEKNQIRARWMTVRYEEHINYTLLWQVLVGAAVLLILTMTWATQIKRRNKALQERSRELQISNVRAKAAAASKADFLAAMSHEIRTPMNGVIGMVDLLRQTKLDDDQRQMLQTVNDSGQSLLTIINDILDFSKIEAGKLDLESIPVSLTDVVEGSAQTTAANATKKGLRLITYVDPELPQFVTGDPVRIRQIIINLGGNAIKFTEEGQVVIRAERLRANDDNKVTIRFSVIDQGIGISEEGQDKLFQAFSQADSSTTRQFGGTGLGLTICKRLTEIMGGEIGVKSQPGEGSEFYVVLPFSHSDKQVQEEKVRNLKGLHILLINGNPTEEATLRRYLEYWHADVTSSADLGTCLDQCLAAKAEDKPYDIVVIGPQWPREEQFEMRGRVTSQSTLSDTRFICLLKGKRRRERLDLPASVCLDVDPLRRAAFLSAVAVAVGRASPEVHYEDEVEDLKATVKAQTVDEALAQGTLILVAEDNPTNRDVIGRQLKLLGYACEMADDGKLALAAWRDKHYGVLLTDCHMPNMDGFELTDAIRNDEKDSETRAPIIAITANALQGEAERCLAAGMDDYLSKPIDMKELRQALRKWMPEAKMEKISSEDPEVETSTTEKTIAVKEKTGDGPIDERALKDMFGDDPEMFKEILNDFIPPSHQIIKDIQNGWKEHSAEAVKQAAHKLKSSAGSIGATELADVCKSLETAGKEEDWEMINKKMPNLDQLMEEIEGFINGL